jgi:hypothetical protein
LFPVIAALRQWCDNWAAGPEAPAVRGMRRSCSASVQARLPCDAGHDVEPRDIKIEAGPGLISTT